tara:strand:- start:744 stop:1064 length:321 start_codon:yes stop_codon:yes gene_type:complete
MRFFTEESSVRLKNANAVIRQLRAGEWIFEVDSENRDCYVAERSGYQLWVASGPFHCEVKKISREDQGRTVAFGPMLRHYVWWAAARAATKAAKRIEIKTIKIFDV